jgi:oligopeptide transport system ATP-binding protein
MTPILQVRNLSVTFSIPTRGAWPWTAPAQLRAVRDVSFDLSPGETLGIVGESGSGKSTLARAIVGTVPASEGQVLWQGQDLLKLGVDARRAQRRDVQMIFQDPLAALNPRMPVGEIIAEPLVTHQLATPRSEVKARVRDIMDRVGLLSNQLNRYPHEFSGGQCQRIGIARALILKPKLVVCDEPVSALDVSIQAQVVNLLADLQRDMGLAMIFIAHDLSVVKHISDRIMVMYLGRQMEIAPAKDLIRKPRHPYTRALIASVPIPDPTAEMARTQVVLEGELPSPLRPPSGCAFRTRCPMARPDCAQDVPPLLAISDTHDVACPYWQTPEAAESTGPR